MAIVASVALAITGCTQQSLVVEGSEATIAVAQPFTSYNDQTAYGNTQANNAIVYATNARFTYYDSDASLVRDESFGRYELVSDDPLTVRYTIAEGVSWSDGVPVDGADLLLAWAANSGRFTTPDFSPDPFRDADTGIFDDDMPDGVVFFDGASRAGLQHVEDLPQLGADGRSITLVYDEYFVDWELAFEVGLPAHVVAREALDLGAEEDTESAKQAVVDAIQSADADVLAPLSREWNSGFTAQAFADDPDRFVGSGPYTITAVDRGESVTLTANAEYTGAHLPTFETIVVRTISDPLAMVAALDDGSVDIVVPAPSGDVLSALGDVTDATVRVTDSGTFEHLDLQFDNSRSGHFDDPLVREAFLAVVPRGEIVDALVAPVNPDATTRDSFVLLPGTPGYDDAVETNGSSDFAEVDVVRARELLDDAGVRSPEVCILFDPANPRRVDQFTLIQRSAQRAGFVVTNCSRPDWIEFLGVSRAYDAALFGWNTTNLAVSAAEVRLRSDSPVSNLNYYSSDTVDDLLDELAASDDAGDQRELLARIDAELWADSYGVPLYQYPIITATSDRVAGVATSPLAPGVFWNVWEWRPSEAR